MIELRHVDKLYEKDWFTLKNINLKINKGEFVFLVGPSGSGKTTLMKLIYMDEFPTRGEVIVAGFRASKIRRREIPLLRRKIGVVFQDFKLLPDRNAYDNIAFALQVTGTRRSETQKKVLKALTDVRLSHRRDAYPYQLSGGEQQKISIARALVHEPFVLLADEPTGNIDPEGAAEILQLLREINTKGTAILMATHDLELVKRLPYRRLQIEKGEIKSDTSLREKK
ncbi:MAG: cell division ATP-binding protein FtsE [Candidatus Edwardsbacteria bacterium]